MAYLARIERQHQRNASRLLAPTGLHHREWRILAIVNALGSAPISQVADDAVVERTTLSKMLDRLEARGLIRRDTHEADRRASAVSLTPQGQDFLAETLPLILGLFDQYRRAMPEQEYQQLMRLLKAFRSAVAGADVVG